MNTEQTCYLFLDFDGTVFLNGSIPRENREALSAVQRMGHQVILNTGRSRGSLNFTTREYQGVKWDGMIFGMSDMNYRGVRYHDYALSEPEVLFWVRRSMDMHCWIALGGETERKEFLFDRHPEPFGPEETETVLTGVREWMTTATVTKLTLQRVEDEDACRAGVNVLRMEEYSEVMPEGRDKGAAFLDFCGTWGISPEQCICFGDSLNDLAVFTACPNSVAMRQSPPELRRYASYTASGEFGVAEGIEHFFGKICS